MTTTAPAALLHRLDCLRHGMTSTIGEGDVTGVLVDHGGHDGRSDRVWVAVHTDCVIELAMSKALILLTGDTQSAVCRRLAARYGYTGVGPCWLAFDEEEGIWSLQAAGQQVPVMEWDTLERAPCSTAFAELYGEPPPFAPWLRTTDRAEALLAILHHLDEEGP